MVQPEELLMYICDGFPVAERVSVMTRVEVKGAFATIIMEGSEGGEVSTI